MVVLATTAPPSIMRLLLLLCAAAAADASSNPYSRGCFKERLPGWKKVRVCNSEDPPETAAAGLCRPPDSDFDYTEIRILSQNWEAAFFETWLLQMLLTELLDVPTSVETGVFGKKINFYDQNSSYDFGTSYDYDAFRTATRLGGDCRLANQQDEASYEPCAAVVTEVWEDATDSVLYLEGMVEQPQALGANFQDGWFITRFTVEQDVTLLTYLGMHGEENRKKLAETFLRPTSWKDYCEQVSPNNCTKPDSVAQHGPATDKDNSRYFVEDENGRVLYTGHFRKTEGNDCETNPTTCTGHIAAYPCSWPSYASLQAHWLKIALESNGQEGDGGYTYSQMLELWAAANATRSNLAMQWWQPEVLVQQYVGTDAAFTRVALPDPSMECHKARNELAAVRDRCSGEYSPQLTSPLAACDYSAEAVWKLISVGLREATFNPKIPELLQSPGFEAARRFQLSELQLQEMMSYSLTMGSPREAICQWAVENVEFLQGFAPATYPRVVHRQPSSETTMDTMSIAAVTIGALAVCLVAVTAVFVCLMRQHGIFVTAQQEILFLLLLGSLIVSAGSIVAGLMPSSSLCISATWLVNAGYCLLLVPLLIKIEAINRMAQLRAGKKMKRVVLSKMILLVPVAIMSILVIAFLTAWTVVDAPHVLAFYELSDGVDEFGNTILNAYEYCGSNSQVWNYFAVVWPALVLALAASLAWATKDLAYHFGEARTLARRVWAHSVFLAARIALLVYSLNTDSIAAVYVSRSIAFVFGLDMITGTWIYFAPKFLSPDDEARQKGGLTVSVSMSDQDNGSRRRKSSRESPVHVTDDDTSLNFVNNFVNNLLPEEPKNHKSLVGMESAVVAGGSTHSSQESDAVDGACDKDVYGKEIDERQSTTPLLPLHVAKTDGLEGQRADEATKESLLVPPRQGNETPATTTATESGLQFRHVTVPTKLGVSVEPDAEGGMRVCEVDPSSDFYGRIFPGEVVVGFGGVDTTTIDAEELKHLLQNYKTLTVRSSPSSVPSTADEDGASQRQAHIEDNVEWA